MADAGVAAAMIAFMFALSANSSQGDDQDDRRPEMKSDDRCMFLSPKFGSYTSWEQLIELLAAEFDSSPRVAMMLRATMLCGGPAYAGRNWSRSTRSELSLLGPHRLLGLTGNLASTFGADWELQFDGALQLAQRLMAIEPVRSAARLAEEMMLDRGMIDLTELVLGARAGLSAPHTVGRVLQEVVAPARDIADRKRYWAA